MENEEGVVESVGAGGEGCCGGLEMGMGVHDVTGWSPVERGYK